MNELIKVDNITFEYENDDQSVGVLKDFSVEFKNNIWYNQINKTQE